MNRILLATILSILTQHELAAQSKWGFENYHYLDDPASSAIVPVIHIETQKNIYAEVRYNYEAAGTITLLGGKTFAGGRKMSYRIKPMTGFSFGKFTGITGAVETDLAWKALYFSLQAQQSIATRESPGSFFFSWSELGCDLGRHFFGGIALQYSLQDREDKAEPGIVAGISINRFSFPCYLFNPFQPGAHLVIGLNYEWSFKKKNRS